jgi:hypothetical protein
MASLDSEFLKLARVRVALIEAGLHHFNLSGPLE